MGRGFLYVACLAVLLSGSVILVPHKAEADPYHLQVENTIFINPVQIQDNNFRAQSFVPTVSFQVSRVSLYIVDLGGGGLLDVSVRPDTAGSPSVTVLASGARGVPLVEGWVDFDVTPYAQLSSGQSYWIVVRPQSGGGQQFEWWDSDNDSAYILGTGASSSDGIGWNPEGVDFAFRVYGFERPNFSFAVTASPSTVMWGDAVIFRIDFGNAGPASSAGLWVNVTLPSALTYLSDDAPSIGGVRTGAHNYTFTGVTPGSYTFNLTATTDGVVANGTVTVTDVLFEAADHIGSPMTQELRSVPVTIVTNLGFTFGVTPSVSSLNPGDTVVFRIDFANLGPAPSAGVWVNITLPPELTYLADDVATIGGVRTGPHNYTLTNVAPGSYAFNFTAIAGGGVPNGTVVITNFRFEASDYAGLPHDQAVQIVPVTILTVVSYVFDAQASRSLLPVGENVVFRTGFDQQGPGTSAGLWINVTLPLGLTYIADDAAVVGGVRTGAHNYSFANVAPGSYVFNFTAVADGVVANGTVVITDFRFEATDNVGASLTSDNRAVPVTIVTDLAFTFGIAPTASSLAPGGTVVLRVDFANLGPATSAGLWVNVTIPSGLTYVTDDAALIGGVRTGAHNYTFSALAPASYAFNVTISADGGVVNGTQTTVEFQLTARDSFGTALSPEQRNATITLRNALLGLSLTLNAAVFDPGDAVVVTATVTNLGLENAQNLSIQGDLDVNLTYESSSPAGTYDLVTRTVQWNLPSIAAQTQRVLVWTGRVKVDTPDLASLQFSISLSYQDASGTALTPLAVSDLAGVRAPVITPILQLNRASAGRGDWVTATLLYVNTGTGTTGRAWANWTLSDAFALVSLSPALSPIVTPKGFAVSLTNVTPGVHALQAQLEVTRGMDDGLALSLEVSWAALGKNGDPLPPATFNENVRLDAPVVRLGLEALGDRVDRGSTFALDVTIRNTGHAPATGILEFDLPSGVAYVADNGTLPPTSSANRVEWEIANVGAESVFLLQIKLHAFGDLGPRSFRLMLNYSEGRGSTPVAAFSNGVAVEVVAVGGVNAGPAWWWWLPFLAMAVPPALFFYRRWRRGPLRLHEVFVVDRGGAVLAHQSDTLIEERDKDLIAAAFTAVQEFVRHHFSRNPDESIRTLEFGERKILLEQGGSHYIAVVFSGEETSDLRNRVRRLSKEINERFGHTLSDWQGDTEAIKGIAPLLPDLWRRDPTVKGALSRLRASVGSRRKD